MNNDWYALASVRAATLRQDVRVALIANSIDATPEAIAYVARRLVSREGASLLDEIESLKSGARQALGS